jgi:hypothetical protein
VALVGSDSLLAKELRELLHGKPRIELISAAAENAAMLGADDEGAGAGPADGGA